MAFIYALIVSSTPNSSVLEINFGQNYIYEKLDNFSDISFDIFKTLSGVIFCAFNLNENVVCFLDMLHIFKCLLD